MMAFRLRDKTNCPRRKELRQALNWVLREMEGIVSEYKFKFPGLSELYNQLRERLTDTPHGSALVAIVWPLDYGRNALGLGLAGQDKSWAAWLRSETADSLPYRSVLGAGQIWYITPCHLPLYPLSCLGTYIGGTTRNDHSNAYHPGHSGARYRVPICCSGLPS